MVGPLKNFREDDTRVRRQKFRKSVVLMVLLMFVFTMLPVVPSEALGVPTGTLVTITKSPGKAYYAGHWSITRSGYLSGKTGNVLIYLAQYQNGTGLGYNYVHNRDYSTVAGYLNGVSSYVNSQRSSCEVTLNGTRAIHIRDFAKLCGAAVIGPGSGTVFIETTRNPEARISPPSSVKAGSSAKISISGQSFVPMGGDQRIEYELSVNGTRVSSGSGSASRTFSKQVSYTFPTAGNYTVRLDVRDGVGRTGYDQKTIRVTSGPSSPTPPGKTPPPPPPPDPDPIEPWEPPAPPPPPPPPPDPVAQFYLPSECSPGQVVNVRDNSYAPAGASIVDWDWRVTPSSGVKENTLGPRGGTLVFDELGEYTVRLTVTDSNGNSDTATETIEVVNEPPTARIVAPETCLQGEDIAIYSASYDRDGEIARSTWSVTPVGFLKPANEGEEIRYEKDQKVYFDKEGEYKVTLTVEDNWGATDTTTHTVTVKPAIPQAFFVDDGAWKQNRKITLTEKGVSPERYPIVPEQNRWEFIPVGDGATDNAIKVKAQDPQVREVLFKEPGNYKARLKVTNTAGHTSEWYELLLEIRPDEPPVADFVVQSAYIRDEGTRKATITPVCTSYSPDGDIISKRVWRYKYDSNNNGSFDDENWVIFSSDNDSTPSIVTPDVGKYLFELEVTEDFGDDTIAEFITPDDYLKADTSEKFFEDKRSEVINVRPSVGFDIYPKKKADIVFTVGNVDSNKIKNLNGLIAQYLESELSANSVDYGTIRAVESFGFSSESADMQAILSNWRSITVPDGTVISGGWEYDQNLRAVVATGGYRPARAWYDPSPEAMEMRDANIKFTWGIRGSSDYSHGEAGYMFRIQDDRNYYAYIWDNHSACGNIALDGGDALVKVVNGNLQIIQQKTGFPRYHANQKENIEINLEGNRIRVYLNGTLRYDINDNTFSKGSHGFYVWDQQAAYFNNITIETTRIITLDEILKQPEWRDDALHFLVNISDVTYPEFNDPVKSAYIYSRLLNDEIDFSVMGTGANQSQANSIIARNDGNGIFVNNTNMNTAMQQITDYIIGKLESSYAPIDKYVLLNEEVYYKTHYSDPEQDPKYEERWKYVHDPLYFDSSLGLAAFHNQWIPAPVNEFDKVGYFQTTFQARDNPKDDNRFDEYRLWSYEPEVGLDLFVHRRPVAAFSVQRTEQGGNYKVNIVSSAYDLDHLVSRADKGIVGEKWEWKDVNATSWNSGKPSLLPKGNEYLVRYTVKDPEGCWSFPAVQMVSGSNINLPPVAMFTVNSPVMIGETLQIEDLSYDPNGDPITQREWVVTKPNGSRGSPSSSPPTSFSEIGAHTLTLRVFDGELWSEPFSQVVDVFAKPVARFTVSPNPVYEYDPVTYNDTSYDPAGLTLTNREWRVRKGGNEWMYVNPPQIFQNVDGPGSYTIGLRVRNSQGIWSDWYEQTLTVLAGFVVEGYVLPNPGERGRDIKVVGKAIQPSNGQPTQIDKMEAVIVVSGMPDGKPAARIDMIRDGSEWYCLYRVPEVTQKNRWPDDGAYTIRIIGSRASELTGEMVTREAELPVSIKGHILDRRIIRTYAW